MNTIGETTRWLDGFFQAFYAHHPVDATFIGVHEHDGRLPDLSDAGTGDAIAGMRGLLETLPREPSSDGVAALDTRLAAGFLRIQLRELESQHFQRGNPSLYTGEAVFGVLSLFLTDFAPFDQRVERAIERLRAIPAFLETGRSNVRSAPPTWTGRALRECAGARPFLEAGIPVLAREAGSRGDALLHAAEVAAAAFGEHGEHLRTELLCSIREDVGCGEELFSLYLREGHFVTETHDEILGRARAELADARSELARRASELGYPSPDSALAALGDRHPSLEAYPDRHRRVWEEMRALALERDLVTWPDDPIRFAPRPAWVREAAPSLYFLVYRSPAAFGRPPVHECLVPSIDASLPADRRQALLGATHDGVIKLNHVIHHAGIGHHVQNGHAFRSRSRVGRVAAVDGASRIAMFCGGTMAEGWACYATDLMREAGALTRLEEVSELHARVRMCTRAAVDVLLHTGRIDFDEATAMYEREAGMPAGAARAEAVKNSMFPGTAVMYMLGTDAIHALRREISAADGAAFTPRGFHDELLSYGSVPVTLAAESMRSARRGRRADAEPAC